MLNLTEIKTEIEPIYSNSVEITTQDDYSKAADFLKMIKNKISWLEDKRMSYTKPLDESKKQIKADFDEIINPLETLVNDVKTKMLVWQKEEQKRRDEEQKRIDAEALKSLKEKGESEAVVPVVESVKSVKGSFATVSVRKIQKWRLVDFKAVPDEFKTVNDSLVTQAVKGGLKSIPGIEIYEEETLAIR